MSIGVDFERYQFGQRLKELQDKVLSLNFRAPTDQVPQQMRLNEPQYLNNQFYPHPQQFNQFPQYFPSQIQYQPTQPIMYQNNDDSSSEEDEPPKFIRQNTKSASLQSIPLRTPLQNDIIKQQRKQQKRWLEQIMQNDKAQEQQLLGYIEQQNEVIKQLSDKLLNDKRKQEKEEKQKLQEIQRQKEMEKFEEMLAKKQEQMIGNIKRDILDSVDPYNYGYYHNQYNYAPQMQSYQQIPPIQQYSSQIPVQQTPPPVQFQTPFPMLHQAQFTPQMQNFGYPSPHNGYSQLQNGQSLSRIGHMSMNKVDNILKGI